MKKRKVLATVLSITLILSAALAIYLDINKQSQVLNTSKEENTELDKETLTDSSPSTESYSEPIPAQPAVSNTPIQVLNKWGNTQSNIVNGGHFVQNGSNILFSYHDNKTLKGFNLSVSQLDAATALREIYNEQVSYINIVGEWVYFINNKGYICKIKQTGEKFTIVKSGRFYSLLFHDNNLYFMEDTKIMTVPLQSPNEIRQITSSAYSYTISYDGKSLFYIEQTLDPLKRNIYQVSLNDFNKKLFFNSENKYSIIGMHTYNDYLYLQALNFGLYGNTSASSIDILKIHIPTSMLISDKYDSMPISTYNQCNIFGKNMYMISQLNKKLLLQIKNLENDHMDQAEFDTDDLEITNFYVLDDLVFITLQNYIKSEIWIYDHNNKRLKKSTFDGYYFLIKS